MPVKKIELLERASMHVFSSECINGLKFMKRECLCVIDDELRILPWQTPQYGVAYSCSHVLLNVRSAFLKMRPPEKCELRTPTVGPKRRFNLQRATTCVKLQRKTLFGLPTFPSQALRTSDLRVFKLRLAWSLPLTSSLTRGNHRSLMSWLAQLRRGMCTTPCWKFLNQTWQMRPPEK